MTTPSLWLTTLYVGLGGCLGAMLRYHITLLSNRYFGVGFPYGTLIVNCLGGIAIGFLLELALTTPWLDNTIRAFLVTGLLGGLTTFSTFSAETMSFLTGGQIWVGFFNILANLILALGGVGLGRSLALWL